MDIYLPPNVEADSALGQLGEGDEGGAAAADNGRGGGAAADAAADGGPAGAPVVLFCHGGVWASGAKWHYAPLATRLAQAGVITAVGACACLHP